MIEEELERGDQHIVNQMLVSMCWTCMGTLVISYFVDSPWMLLAYLGVIVVNVLVAAARIELAHGRFNSDDVFADLEDY